jgi:repressor LexA
MRQVSGQKREEILVFIESYWGDNGFSPTQEEIREAVGLSSRSHVHYYLDQLEQGGLIERTARSPRGLRPVDPGQGLAGAAG